MLVLSLCARWHADISINHTAPQCQVLTELPAWCQTLSVLFSSQEFWIKLTARKMAVGSMLLENEYGLFITKT